MNSARPMQAHPQRQRGAAALIVVLLLFFIVSMVAAYTSRNLIFEQRTGANQYRSTQAMEAAQAGLEWAKAMLNTGRIDAACQPSTTVTDTTFRERYLLVDANGNFTARGTTGALPTTIATQLTPTCVFNGTDWDCDCPSNAAPTITPPTGTALAPAFRMRIGVGAGAFVPGTVRIEAVGCTRLNNDCLAFSAPGALNEGRAMATELVALVGGLPSPPLAALTAGAAVNLAGATLQLSNAHAASGGATIQARSTVAVGSSVLSSLPGTPGDLSVIANDVSLPDGSTSTGADGMFAGVFNLWPATHKQQPAAVVLGSASAGCSAGGCSAAAVRDALALNPGRVLWIEGDLTVDSSGDIGSAAAPAMLVVEGDLVFTTAATIHGLVYLRTGTWATSGAGTVRGAVVAQAGVAGSGSTSIIYDADVLRRLRLNNGSFVQVPGGWKDFCSTPTGLVVSGSLGC